MDQSSDEFFMRSFRVDGTFNYLQLSIIRFFNRANSFELRPHRARRNITTESPH